MRDRAYRRHQRARIRARHLRDHRLLCGWPELPPPKDLAVRHPFDCGNRCLLCHGDKLLGLRRARERRAWMRELENGTW